MTKTDKEWYILVALFKATVEQQSMLIGETKQHSKLIFNRWLREGERLLKPIHECSDNNYLETITETIENSVHKLRKS